MYYKLKKGVLRDLTEKAIKKAGTFRKLAKEMNFSKTTVYKYKNEIMNVTEENAAKLEQFLGTKINRGEIIEKLPDNWKQVIGGKNCAAKKLRNGTLNLQLENARKNVSPEKTVKAWHKKMKEEKPEEYYKIQHERFKKAAGYKFITANRERVRNELELETANILKNKNINYVYEPMIKVDGLTFFPDFLIEDKIIIECTMWRGYDKALKLKDKITHLKKRYEVYVLIPKKIDNFYQSIKDNLIYDLESINTTFK